MRDIGEFFKISGFLGMFDTIIHGSSDQFGKGGKFSFFHIFYPIIMDFFIYVKRNSFLIFIIELLKFFQ